MKKKIIFLASLFLCVGFLSAQDARWLPGYMINLKGEKIEGEVKSGTMQGKKIKSVRFRKNKDDKTSFFKAKELKEIAQGDIIVSSVKIKKKRYFYRAIYKGKNLSIYEDPDANMGFAGGVKQGMNHLAYKPGFKKLKKVSNMFFKKDMKKICGDKPEWVKQAKDKKWLTYNNIKEVAKFYDSL